MQIDVAAIPDSGLFWGLEHVFSGAWFFSLQSRYNNHLCRYYYYYLIIIIPTEL